MRSLLCGWSVTQIQGARPYQEDRFAVADGPTLHFDSQSTFVVEFGVNESELMVVIVDGMGGMGHGDVAAEVVVREFVEIWLDFAGAGVTRRECLEIAAYAANQRIAQVVREEPRYAGMGTTLLGAVFDRRAKTLYWVSVGDSLLLRVRNGVLEQLNEEHSARRYLQLKHERARASGENPDPAELASLAHPGALESAITGDPLDWVDLPDCPTSIRAGDVFVVASDGLDFLARAVVAERIGQCMSGVLVDGRQPPLALKVRAAGEAIVADLTTLAHPHQDNATLAIIGFVAS